MKRSVALRVEALLLGSLMVGAMVLSIAALF